METVPAMVPSTPAGVDKARLPSSEKVSDRDCKAAPTPQQTHFTFFERVTRSTTDTSNMRARKNSMVDGVT